METRRKLLALALLVVALAVAVHFVFSEVYGNLTPAVGRLWSLLNLFMAPGILAVLVCACREWRRVNRAGRGVDYPYLYANVLLFTAMVAALWFFRNWLAALTGGPGAGSPSPILWLWVNGLFVVIAAATAVNLWFGRRIRADSPAPNRAQPEDN